MKNEIAELVATFANSVIAQDEARTAAEGNRHATAQLHAFDTLTERFGDRVREALTSLFVHDYLRVRCMAAAFLLRYRHQEARTVLEELSDGTGIAALGAQCTLGNWESGDWELDPEPQA